MTVLARSAGLPARMAVGFNPQSADENGVQTIYEIDGHSWTEIYFADYGWIEFEPTATFVNSAELMPQGDARLDSLDDLSAIPIPDAVSTGATVWTYLFWGVLILGVALFVQAVRPVPSLSGSVAGTWPRVEIRESTSMKCTRLLYRHAPRMSCLSDCSRPLVQISRSSDIMKNSA